MPKPRILIPVIHRPATPHWREPRTEPALRVVPRYAGPYGGREGATDLPARMACPQGFDICYGHGATLLPMDWLAAPVWSGALGVVEYHGGRSSSCYVVRIEADDGGEPVEGLMSCLAFLDVLPHIVNGRALSGRWTARKRGQNYLIEGAS